MLKFLNSGKSFKFAALIFALAASPSNGGPPVVSHGGDQSEEVNTGITKLIVHRKVDEYPFVVIALRIDRAQYSGKLESPESANSLINLRDYGERLYIMAAINGGFLASYSPPVPAGLLKIDGKILSNLAPNDPVMDAVVCVGNDTNFYTVARFANNPSPSDCIQTGPLLIIGQREVVSDNPVDKEIDYPFVSGRFERAFIGRDVNGATVIGWTSTIDLISLSQLLVGSIESGGFGLTDAAALPGKNSAGLIWRDQWERLQHLGGGDHPMPSIIAFVLN